MVWRWFSFVYNRQYRDGTFICVTIWHIPVQLNIPQVLQVLENRMLSYIPSFTGHKYEQPYHSQEIKYRLHITGSIPMILYFDYIPIQRALAFDHYSQVFFKGKSQPYSTIFFQFPNWLSNFNTYDLPCSNNSLFPSAKSAFPPRFDVGFLSPFLLFRSEKMIHA